MCFCKGHSMCFVRDVETTTDWLFGLDLGIIFSSKLKVCVNVCVNGKKRLTFNTYGTLCSHLAEIISNLLPQSVFVVTHTFIKF